MHMVSPQNKKIHNKNKWRNSTKQTEESLSSYNCMTERHQPHHQLYPYAPLPCKIVMHIQQYSPKYHKKETSFKPSYHSIIGSLPLHSKKVTQSLKKNSASEPNMLSTEIIS